MSKIFIILSFLAISSSQIELESSSITYYGSHPFHDWQGVSNSANYQINCSESNTCKISISIPVESFDGKNENRDSNMLDVVEEFSYPNIEFEIDHFILEPIQNSYNVTGMLTFHGISNLIESKVDCNQNGAYLDCKSSFQIKLSNYKIIRPALLFIKIDDLVKIDCLFSFKFPQ